MSHKSLDMEPCLTFSQVQLDIRTGHQQTVDKVLNWLDDEGGVKDTSICDAGCGTGSLSLPLALRVSTHHNLSCLP